MKNIVLLFCLLISATAFCQENSYTPLNWSKPENLSKIYVVRGATSIRPNWKGDTIAIYTVDESQNIIQKEGVDSGVPNGFFDYIYNDKNQLQSRKDYGRWIYSRNENGEEIKSWDGDLVLGVQKFFYKEDRLIRELQYEGGSDMLSARKEYRYNDQDKLIKEMVILAPAWNTIPFKPNSTEIDFDAKMPKIATLLRKEFETNGNTTNIRYFKNDTLTGKAIEITNKAGKIVESHSLGINDEVRSKYTYTYNKAGQLIEMNRIETNVGGFGYEYDSTLGSQYKYQYNSEGFRNGSTVYEKGKLISTRHYIYKQSDVD